MDNLTTKTLNTPESTVIVTSKYHKPVCDWLAMYTSSPIHVTERARQYITPQAIVVAALPMEIARGCLQYYSVRLDSAALRDKPADQQTAQDMVHAGARLEAYTVFRCHRSEMLDVLEKVVGSLIRYAINSPEDAAHQDPRDAANKILATLEAM